MWWLIVKCVRQIRLFLSQKYPEIERLIIGRLCKFSFGKKREE